jgi:isopenicillin N synthase-like dioxygenase
MTVPISTPSLPVISLSEHKTLESLAIALYSACTGEGFLYVSGHGIPQATIDEAFGVAQDYFLHARPEDKVDLKENTGYTAV